MTKLSEEYNKNRLRTLTQIMEAGERMKGRGQIPWAQKLLIEEMDKPEPCMGAIKEMKTLLEELGLVRIKSEDKYKAGSNQMQLVEQVERKQKMTQPLSRAQVQIGTHTIPLSLIDYYKQIATHRENHGRWLWNTPSKETR